MQTRYKDCCGIHGVLSPFIAIELSMTDEQQTAKYISELKYPIQKRMILRGVFSIDDVCNKAMKIERLHIRAPPFRRLLSIEEPLRWRRSSTEFHDV